MLLYNKSYFIAQSPGFGHWELLQVASCTLWIISPLFFLITSLLSVPQAEPGSTCVFLAQALEPTMFPKSPFLLF